jgi:aminodeoxyfutalosine deaminase
LNSDDPAMFGVSLTEEYKLSARRLGLDWTAIKTLCLNGVRASFLPDLYKESLLEEFEKDLADIESDM